MQVTEDEQAARLLASTFSLRRSGRRLHTLDPSSPLKPVPFAKPTRSACVDCRRNNDERVDAESAARAALLQAAQVAAAANKEQAAAVLVQQRATTTERKRQEQIHALELERTEKRARHQQQVKQLEVQLAAKDLALSQQALISSGRLNAAWRDAGEQLRKQLKQLQQAERREQDFEQQLMSLRTELSAAQSDLERRRTLPRREEAAAAIEAAQSAAIDAERAAAEADRRRVDAEMEVKALSIQLTLTERASEQATSKLAEHRAATMSARTKARTARAARRDADFANDEDDDNEDDAYEFDDPADGDYMDTDTHDSSGGGGGGGRRSSTGDAGHEPDDGHGQRARSGDVGGDPSQPVSLPVESIFDGKEFTWRIELLCVGLKAYGVSSNQMQNIVEYTLSTMANLALPTYINKKQQRKTYFPSVATIHSYDGHADVLCDVNATFGVMGASRTVAESGKDPVLDNHIGVSTDGCRLAGEDLQSTMLHLTEHRKVTCGIEVMADGTSKAKAAAVANKWDTFEVIGEQLRKVNVALPPSLAGGRDKSVDEYDVEAMSRANAAVFCIDRGASELKAVKELEPLKRKELQLLLGRRLIRSRSCVYVCIRTAARRVPAQHLLHSHPLLYLSLCASSSLAMLLHVLTPWLPPPSPPSASPPSPSPPLPPPRWTPLPPPPPPPLPPFPATGITTSTVATTTFAITATLATATAAIAAIAVAAIAAAAITTTTTTFVAVTTTGC